MKSFLWKFIIVILLILVAIIYWFYYNVYSEGERKGTLIKITKKGNVFKTVEGEMWLSCRQVVNTEKFYFSIISSSIADSLMNLQDECLQVTYKQYRKTLPWRGETQYIIVGFKRLQ
jgi:uncharacterized membrane protein YqiK